MKDTMTLHEQEVLDDALSKITARRIEEIFRRVQWENGGVLSKREPPDVPEMIPEEDAVIRAVWDSIPSGSSCWMTALHRMRNAREKVTL